MADLHLAVDRSRGGLAGQIAGELREAIRSGRLGRGARLPASRDLARDLGLSRGVVVEAYEQLVAEGFLDARVGVGTRVASGPVTRAEPGLAVRSDEPGANYYGHRPTSPDLSAFPRQAWLAAIRHVLATLPGDCLDYGDPGGVAELRAELAAYLRRVRAADTDTGEVVVVTGVAQGLSLVVRALVESGAGRAAADGDHGPLPAASDGAAPAAIGGESEGAVSEGAVSEGAVSEGAVSEGAVLLAVEEPTSPRQLPLLRRAGARLTGVPVDAEGIDVAALARTGARAVLLTPAHHYPTGVVLSPRRRAELIAWAADTGAVILEDDYDAEFRFDREPIGCLQGLAPDRVVLAGSVSKALAPGLRLGWLVAPPAVAAAVRRARGELDLGSPVIDQYALARFLSTGGYDRHLRRMRREYRRRRDALVGALAEHLPGVRAHGISAGLHLYAELPAGWDERRVAEAARACGLTVDPLPSALVIGFARFPEHRIAEAVRQLRVLTDRQDVRT
ncbi:aminotransferase-like domain-containing protein [Microtetraspora niveoalba]|uniref:aminotransferase-like domain-containing protein n=1 Tax=Microtetraspora niveoalba TaxID=46175 RepID=UPI00082DB59F|nr:PLP-dependent aminotransferase family protein [Microtetraspora niveoalba]